MRSGIGAIFAGEFARELLEDLREVLGVGEARAVAGLGDGQAVLAHQGGSPLDVILAGEVDGREAGDTLHLIIK